MNAKRYHPVMRTEPGNASDLGHGGGGGETRPDPIGFRWYLHSSLPVSWLAHEVIPAVRYLLHTERLPVVNVRRGRRHGTHLEVIAYSGDGRPVPWTQVLARMRPPEEEQEVGPEMGTVAGRDFSAHAHGPAGPDLPRPHGMFEWLAHSDLRRWPGHAQDLRERALTRMIDSIAVTLEPGGQALLGQSAPLETVAEIMLVTADAHPLGVRYGAISLRSSAQRFLDWPGADAGLWAEFERGLSADRAMLRSLVERMLDGAGTPSSASWRRTAFYCMGLFDGAFLVSALPPEVLEEISRQQRGTRPESTGPPGLDDQPAARLTSHQILLKLLYTQLPLLGVSWRQKYYLSWAIAETVDEMAG